MEIASEAQYIDSQRFNSRSWIYPSNQIVDHLYFQTSNVGPLSTDQPMEVCDLHLVVIHKDEFLYP